MGRDSNKNFHIVILFLYMKAIKKLKWILLIISVGIIGALVNENFIHFYIPKTGFYSILIGGTALAIITRFIKPAREFKSSQILLSLTMGTLLVPYLGLVVGYSDIFAKDQAGIEVKEVRFKIVNIEFKKEGEDVWETNIINKEAILHPGKNWVWLGRQNLGPVGYDRERGIMETETDIVWDQNLITQEHPGWQVPTSENDPTCVRSEDLGEGKYTITFFRREEFERPILRPTGAEGQPPPSLPIFPDVGLDVVVGENGRVERITLHPLLPEPFGALTVEVPLGNL